MIIYACKRCGEIIYRYWYGKDSFGPPTLSELKARIASRCPRCNREFETPKQYEVIIRKADRKKQMQTTSEHLHL